MGGWMAGRVLVPGIMLGLVPVTVLGLVPGHGPEPGRGLVLGTVVGLVLGVVPVPCLGLGLVPGVVLGLVLVLALVAEGERRPAITSASGGAPPRAERSHLARLERPPDSTGAPAEDEGLRRGRGPSTETGS